MGAEAPDTLVLAIPQIQQAWHTFVGEEYVAGLEVAIDQQVFVRVLCVPEQEHPHIHR